jgi:hypothetical protein
MAVGVGSVVEDGIIMAALPLVLIETTGLLVPMRKALDGATLLD